MPPPAPSNAPTAAPPRRFSWRAHGCAIGLLLHVVAVVTDLNPFPTDAWTAVTGSGHRDADAALRPNATFWQDALVQDEILRWSERMGMSPERAREHAQDAADLAAGWRRPWRSIFGPYLDALHLHQSWPMFPSGSRIQGTIVVRVSACEREGACQTWPLFRSGTHASDLEASAPPRVSEESRARLAHLAHPRLRSELNRWIWSGSERRALACEQLARAIMRSDPWIDEVQCEVERGAARAPPPLRAALPLPGLLHRVSRASVSGGRP